MNILHVAGGVGSITASVRKQHHIIGNIEDRRDYYTGTFELNYPGAFMVTGLDQVPEFDTEVDLIVGHPKCGNFSNLNMSKKTGLTSNFQLFKDCIAVYQPKVFFFDNLLKSLKTFPKEYWAMDGYDLQFIEVNNWDYGNCQKFRKRLFVVGSKVGFTYVDQRLKHNTTLKDVIGDLPNYDVPEINHVFAKDNDRVNEFRKQNFGLGEGGISHKEFSDIVDQFVHADYIHMHYRNGKFRKRPGYKVCRLDSYGNTLTTHENKFLRQENNIIRCLTIRERARIQGIPDDFIFKYKIRKHGLVQTGACIPNQFVNILINQIKNHLNK